ncbi:hypothetical protein D3C85_1152050 [compost metagenome]
MNRYNFLMICNPVAGREVDFNEWYTNQHLPDVLRVPGFIGAQRFQVAGETTLPGQYITIFEIETDDPAATLGQLQHLAGTPEMPISDALDVTSVSGTLLAPITARLTQ